MYPDSGDNPSPWQLRRSPISRLKHDTVIQIPFHDTGAFVLHKPVLAIALAVVGTSPTAAADLQFSHQEWTTVLQRFVDDRGFVDYDALAKNRKTFDSYIERLVRTSPENERALFSTRDDRLAYYINAYNAQVFAGVLDRGPEKVSVWKGGLISGYRFFVKRKIELGGRTMSLKHLEDNVIRAQFQDPRIHAALNCASISCPRLPREAFLADRLDQQLDAAMREFVADEQNVEVDTDRKTVRLSKIFDWFKRDFLDYELSQGNDRPALLDYINRYRGHGTQLPYDYRVEFLPYDKAINQQ